MAQHASVNIRRAMPSSDQFRAWQGVLAQRCRAYRAAPAQCPQRQLGHRHRHSWAAAPGAEVVQNEEMKHRMEDTWNEAASMYDKHVIEGHLVQGLYPTFEEHLVPALRGKPGVRILDVASASGEPAVTLAAALQDSQVVSTDFVAPYLELGKARAARLGLTNIEFETADAEDLHRYPDASFDAVTCSLGLMFMPNHQQALSEFTRVLKPGGLFAATVWQGEEAVPFFHITKQLASEYDQAITTAASNIAVRFEDPSELLADMAAAGFEGVECHVLSLAFSFPAGVWWKGMLEMPLPVKPTLMKAQEARGPDGGDVFEEARQRLQQRLQERGWLSEDEALHIPNNDCWFITAKKQAA